MATTDNSFNGLTERCEECGMDTLHEVNIQIVTESTDGDNTQFSREPYRVRECQRCGNRDRQRMNNA